jgi:hypothetical protein
MGNVLSLFWDDPDSIRNNKTKVIKIVKKHGMTIQFSSNLCKNDKNIMLIAI